MSYNVLIVDDSEIIRSVVRKAIVMAGVDTGEIHEAADGLAALETLKGHWIDIVFADINMPRMTGLEMVTQMAKDGLTRSIPVIIISTERSIARIDELQSHGIAAYIKKPFRPEDIRDAVTRVLAERQGGAGE